MTDQLIFSSNVLHNCEVELPAPHTITPKRSTLPSEPNPLAAGNTEPLRVACIGGGPGGLFAAIALSRMLPNVTVDVFERNNESDVFGFGVVFSDATLDNVDAIDSVLRQTLTEYGVHWDTIDVRLKGTTISAGGNGMSAVHRRVLLGAMRRRATELGVLLHFGTEVTVDQLDESHNYDLIVASDGTSSATREQFLGELGHTVEQAEMKFIWFGTTHHFDGLTFLHKQSPHGNFAVHGYPIGSGLSTFIVETDETTWRRAELDGFDVSAPPGPSDLRSQRYLEELFAEEINGHDLVANNSRWANFRTRRTRRWSARAAHGTPVVFLGDAVHTAHFSVGSGTKMAMEDAAVLAQAVAPQVSDLDAALEAFQDVRRPQVAKIQDSAGPSLSWWDHFGDYYCALEPWQFGFHFFSRAISAAKIGQRDPGFLDDALRAWHAEHDADPLDTPLRIGEHTFTTRMLRLSDHGAAGVVLSDGTTRLETSPGDAGVPVLTAPSSAVTSLDPGTRAALDAVCARGPAAVVVRGGTELTRVLCAERIRMQHGVTAIVIDQPTSVRVRRATDQRDDAVSLILSGRADAVAFEPESNVPARTVAHAELIK